MQVVTEKRTKKKVESGLMSATLGHAHLLAELLNEEGGTHPEGSRCRGLVPGSVRVFFYRVVNSVCVCVIEG